MTETTAQITAETPAETGAGIPARPARGRPRSDRAHQAVVDAAGDVLMERGMAGFTMEAVATRARVSKATLYKWWPSRSAVAIDGFFARVRESVSVPETASTEQALLFQVDALRELFAHTACGPLMRSLAGQAQSDPDIGDALRERWLGPRRAVSERILRDGIAAGAIRADIDVAVTLDQLFGPLYYRLFFGHEPLTAELARQLVAQVMAAIRAPGTSD
ncbi:TetR/AcrR family transcriptional regulator [Rugosimonospora africana]|uniref:Putative transcriptional regulator, TetR family protein n=1 Tax=Rugosimonospora africana TaxID=556532 RepID=A0A8J3QP42_9ACTN|nr:TetR/AcrR family transcriptional regulator [Rugosimonospora africana]GIH14805.1 putative transcriptional regulator, TetR family protein [Rugosimonospora africana]